MTGVRRTAFKPKQQREVVTSEYILSTYPVNRRWIENHRAELKPFKVGDGRKSFYFKDVVDGLFHPKEISA